MPLFHTTEGKSVAAERFIRNFKNKIYYKHITSISKKVHIDKLDDVVNKYNNTGNSKIKMKPADVKDNTFIDPGQKVMIMILNLKFVII